MTTAWLALGATPALAASIASSTCSGVDSTFAGNARIDFTESMMPGGMMGAGSYMIVRKSSPASANTC